MKRDLALEDTLVEKYAVVSPVLNEYGRRLWADAESRAIIYGGTPLSQPQRGWRDRRFATDATGKTVPYGIYDMACNEAWVNVGQSHDTPQFAVTSIRQLWRSMGKAAYPNTRTLFITADAGGSNGYRSRVWKHELQQFADDENLRIRVNHFPPGTSKWNKIEHRLFCHITQNWRGKPLCTFETIVELIANTRTQAGLRVKAMLDKKKYKKGMGVTKEQMDTLLLHRDDFRGKWNYEFQPRTNLERLF